MIVKELITKLLDMPMDAQIYFRATDENTGTCLLSDNQSNISVNKFAYYNIGDEKYVGIEITDCYSENSEGEKE